VSERVELIAQLTTHEQEAVSLGESLLQLLIDRWGRNPKGRLKQCG
jgi:hypothetical protein